MKKRLYENKTLNADENYVNRVNFRKLKEFKHHRHMQHHILKTPN